MSLVGDALRKARREAAERDSDRRGVLFSAKISDRPTRSNLGLGLAIGALIAIIATVAGGVAVWWLFVRGAPEQPAPITAMQAAPVEAPEPAADDSDQGREQGPQSGFEGSDGTAEPGQPLGPGEIESNPPPDDPVAVPDPDAAEVDVGGAESPDSGAAQPAEDVEGGFLGIEDGAEIYLMEAEIDGVTLSLDFLIYRAEDPFAEINGVEVHLGATIEGFRVKAIERDRVRLSNGRREIVLRAP